MAFPLSYNGKLEFPLRGDPADTAERFYNDAALKIGRNIAIDAEVAVSISNDKLVASYSIKFKKILMIITGFVIVLVGIYFATWEWANPPGLPQTWGRSGVRNPITIVQIVSVMGFFWLWLFGMIYISLARHFRSLLRSAWKELQLP